MVSRKQSSIEDYDFILKEIGTASHSPILVCGQAVNFWAAHYAEQEPDLKKYRPFVSKDLDLLGSLDDAFSLAKQTGAKITRPKKNEPTPLLAKLALLNQEGTNLEVDILRGVHGVLAKDIEKRAVEVGVSGYSCKVSDPITLLKAKISNVLDIPQKKGTQERNDVKHLKILCLCVRAFLRDSLEQLERDGITARQCINIFENAFEVCSNKAARTVAKEHAISWPDVFPQKELLQSQHPKIINFIQHRLIKSAF